MGARVTVRPYRHADSASLFSAVAESRDTLLPWLPWASSEIRSLEEATYAVELYRREAARVGNHVFVLGVFDRVTGHVVGGTGVAVRSWEFSTGEVGWWLRSSRRGEGLATEAAGLMISSMLTPQEQGGWGLRRAVASCGTANLGSVRVAQRLGLRQEGIHRQEQYVDLLGWQDFLSFAVLSHEWDFERHRARAAASWTAQRDQGREDR